MQSHHDVGSERRKVAVAMMAAAATTAIALAVAMWCGSQAADAPSLVDRLALTLKADLFVVAWLAVAIANVARIRFFSDEDIAGSAAAPPSIKLRQAAAFLQNTLEQVALAVPTHLALAVLRPAPSALVFTLAGLFFVGRALFWGGYGRGAAGRALGFGLTFYPSVAALAFSLGLVLVSPSP